MSATVHSLKNYRSPSQEGKYRKNIQTGNESKLNCEQLNSEKCPNLVANLGKCVMNMAENLKYGWVPAFIFPWVPMLKHLETQVIANGK